MGEIIRQTGLPEEIKAAIGKFREAFKKFKKTDSYGIIDLEWETDLKVKRTSFVEDLRESMIDNIQKNMRSIDEAERESNKYRVGIDAKLIGIDAKIKNMQDTFDELMKTLGTVRRRRLSSNAEFQTRTLREFARQRASRAENRNELN